MCVKLFSMRVDHDEEEKIAEVEEIYNHLHVKEAVEHIVARYDQQAFEALAAINLPESRKIHLRNYAESLMGRKK